MRYMDEAIAYVRDNIDMEEVEETKAKMYYTKTPLYRENPALSDEIHDLMEEYSAENDLPEGWWLEECEEHEILMKL